MIGCSQSKSTPYEPIKLDAIQSVHMEIKDWVSGEDFLAAWKEAFIDLGHRQFSGAQGKVLKAYAESDSLWVELQKPSPEIGLISIQFPKNLSNHPIYLCAWFYSGRGEWQANQQKLMASGALKAADQLAQPSHRDPKSSFRASLEKKNITAVGVQYRFDADKILEDKQSAVIGLRNLADAMCSFVVNALGAKKELLGSAEDAGAPVGGAASTPTVTDAREILARDKTQIMPKNEQAKHGKYWWVNHKQTSRVEHDGGYIWSPTEKKGGVRNQAYINLTLVRPGDIVVSYADTVIKAIGVAKGSYVDAPKPAGYGLAGETWKDVGWQVPIAWIHLGTPIRPKEHLVRIVPLLPEKYSPLQKNGDGNQSIYLAGISTELGSLVLGLAGEFASKITRLADTYAVGNKPGKGMDRLSAELLRQVRALHVWEAVQDIRDGTEVPGFGPSTDYDLMVDSEIRLPPNAVFGLAATRALGFQVQPKHFTAGVDSTCFEILEDAGFLIVPKGEAAPATDPQFSYDDHIWAEGRVKLVTHLKKERASGLAKAKKEHFRSEHGHLFCERCKLDPTDTYGEVGEACIEVHHHDVHVAHMPENHRTELKELQCLCANCHRVVHRQLKQGL